MFPKTRRKVDDGVLEKRRSEPCCVCGARANVDASHIKTRGSGGPDELWNVVAHCRLHHIEWGQLGWSKFFKKYPHFAMLLRNLGWNWSGTTLHHEGLNHQVVS